jgi:hypothetical protein
MAGFCTENLHFFKDLLVLCLSFSGFAWYFVWYFVSNPLATFFLVFVWRSHRSWDSETMQSPGPMNSTRDTTDEQKCVMHAHCICRHLPSLETQRFLQQTRNGHGDILTLMFRHKTSFP